VIEPPRPAARSLAALDMLDNKRESIPRRKHGNTPL
jgi:hypothetical protein